MYLKNGIYVWLSVFRRDLIEIFKKYVEFLGVNFYDVFNGGYCFWFDVNEFKDFIRVKKLLIIDIVGLYMYYMIIYII